MGDILGYARVSTSDQDVAGQTMRLTEAGAIKVFTDVRSGRSTDRPGLAALLDYARAGDTLAIVRLDRLGRSLAELLATVAMLKGRSIALLSLEERIDTSSAAGELVFHVFGAIAHFERRLIAERTKDGIAAARARGKQPGRRPIAQESVAAALKLIEAGLSPTRAAKQVGLGRSTVYRELALAGRGSRLVSLVFASMLLWTLAGITHVARAQVVHICWIEHVHETANGVVVYFMKNRRRITKNGVIQDLETSEVNGADLPHATLQVGDKVFAANSPEDGCEFEVIRKDGKVGVQADAYFNPPGLPRTSSAEFIPALPVDQR